MKFITEDDLRTLYRKSPFAMYEVKPGFRLTPGGRQFLNDRGIGIGGAAGQSTVAAAGNRTCGQADRTCGPADRTCGPADRTCGPADRSRGPAGISPGPADRTYGPADPSPPACPPHPSTPAIRTLQAEFLLAGSALVERDVLLAQELFELEQCLGRLAQGETEEGPQCKGCTGFTPDNWDICQEDCFRVTGFHAQSPRGNEIVRLHLLRCRLRELSGQLGDQGRKPVSRIINRLSQLICLSLGGNTCQKKS